MCFSPAASVSTAAVTALIGLVALSRVTKPQDLPLAATPLLFGAQQAVEGGLWLTLPKAPHGALAAALTLVFLLFSQVVWPVYAPLAAILNEPDARRRRWMAPCLALGTGVAVYFLWSLLSGPREAQIVNHCIVYRMSQAGPGLIGLAYLVATSAPLLLSTQRAIFALGLIVACGCIIAYLFYWQAFLSVWCFFAAAGSVVVLGHFEVARRRNAVPMLAGAAPLS